MTPTELSLSLEEVEVTLRALEVYMRKTSEAADWCYVPAVQGELRAEVYRAHAIHSRLCKLLSDREAPSSGPARAVTGGSYYGELSHAQAQARRVK